MNVLVVDDDKSIRVMLQNICASLGAAVTEAVNGKEGLAKIQKQDFDVIFVDYNMPIMGGVEFLKAFFQNKTSSTKVFFMSGTVVLSDIEQDLRNKVHFLSKPFDVISVKKMLSSLL